MAARSAVGTSALTDYIELLAAKEPEPPRELLVVAKTAYQITLEWQDGAYDGGSPVLDYEVWYKKSTDDVF